MLGREGSELSAAYRYLVANVIASGCIHPWKDQAYAENPHGASIVKFPYGSPIEPEGDDLIQWCVLNKAYELLQHGDQLGFIN